MKTLKNTWFLLIGLFFLAVYLLPLNSRLLWQPDETRYAEISREMLERGDWIVPQFLGLRYFEKPVAGYWVNNISQWLFGENNFAVRFGSVFSMAISALLVYFLAWMLWRNRFTASLASLIFLSMFLVMGVGTYSVLDPMISLWLTAAMVSFYLTLRAECVKDKIASYLLLGLACGMGFMTKGFLALAVPVIAVLPIMIQQRRLKELFIYGPLAIISAVVISLPWVLAVAVREPDYWNYFFWIEHIQRFAQDNAQHKSPFWYYLPVLCLAVLPWLALLPGSLLSGWRERKNKPELFFLLSWVIMPLLFFSIAKGKLVTYILPCMAPLALLMAAYAQHAMSNGNLRFLRMNGLFNLMVGLLGVIALLYMGVFSRDPIFTASETMTLLYGLIIFTCWALFGAYAAGKGQYRWIWSAACPVILALLIGYAIPVKVVDSKQPQRFVDNQRQTLQESRYILASSVGLASSIAWELKRKDIILYGGPGELEYGLAYPEVQDRIFNQQNFATWLSRARQNGNVSLALKLQREAVLPSGLPTPTTIQYQGRFALLWYQMQP